jgi:hypothetical protein
MHANASTSSQTAEMLAIILLNNSLLPDDTLTAAKLELIRIAESRQIPSNPRKIVSPEEIAEVSGELNVLDKDIVKQHNHLVQVTSSTQGRGDNSLLIYERENKPCFSLELSHIQFINYSLHIVDIFHISCHDISIVITSLVTRTTHIYSNTMCRALLLNSACVYRHLTVF